MSFTVGSLVRARGREWVVLPDSDDDLLLLRPLGAPGRGPRAAPHPADRAGMVPDPADQRRGGLDDLLLRAGGRAAARRGPPRRRRAAGPHLPGAFGERQLLRGHPRRRRRRARQARPQRPPAAPPPAPTPPALFISRPYRVVSARPGRRRWRPGGRPRTAGCT